LSIRHKIT